MALASTLPAPGAWGGTTPASGSPPGKACIERAFVQWAEWNGPRDPVPLPEDWCVVDISGDLTLALLSDTGQVRIFVSVAPGHWDTKGGGQGMGSAPPLPDGVGYAAVRALEGYAIGYLRTDGTVVARLIDGTDLTAPTPPDGTVYTSIGFADRTLGMLRSDGVAVFMAIGKGTFAGKTPGQSATVAPPAGRKWTKLAGAWDYALLLDSTGRARSVPSTSRATTTPSVRRYPMA
jgi:hypothetical protein